MPWMGLFLCLGLRPRVDVNRDSTDALKQQAHFYTFLCGLSVPLQTAVLLDSAEKLGTSGKMEAWVFIAAKMAFEGPCIR